MNIIIEKFIIELFEEQQIDKQLETKLAVIDAARHTFPEFTPVSLLGNNTSSIRKAIIINNTLLCFGILTLVLKNMAISIIPETENERKMVTTMPVLYMLWSLIWSVIFNNTAPMHDKLHKRTFNSPAKGRVKQIKFFLFAWLVLLLDINLARRD